jgi:uncharacterized protein (DUF736 family)
METAMPAIGYVTKSKDGKSYKGQIKTLSVRAPIEILPNTAKNGDTQPDFRIYSQSVEIGAGWVKTAESSGKDYVSLSLADPAFGGRKLFANLGLAAGQDDANVFAVIWNPPD